MIVSGINDNIERITILHELAKTLYEETKDSEFRKFGSVRNGSLNFDLAAFDKIRKEEAICSLLVAWSVISVESLVNHIIAQRAGNDFVARLLIENTKKAVDGAGGKQFTAELQIKIQIVGEDSQESRAIAESLGELIRIRNRIVHDKPYRYEQLEDDVSMKLISKFDDPGVTIRFDDLQRHFLVLDKVLAFLSVRDVEDEIKSFRFNELMVRPNA